MKLKLLFQEKVKRQPEIVHAVLLMRAVSLQEFRKLPNIPIHPLVLDYLAKKVLKIHFLLVKNINQCLKFFTILTNIVSLEHFTN